MVLVTIGLPVFNGENYLESTLASLRSQTHTELEIIVADNASTDGTVGIVEAAMADDDRVRLVRSSENVGATANYNRIVPLATGRYFKWAAHDDLCEPRFVAACVEALESDPGAVLSYPRTILIGAENEVLDPEFVDGLALGEPDPVDRLRHYLPHLGEQHPIFGVIRTSALRRTRLIGNHWGGDMVTLGELLLQGRFVEVDERLFLRRYHPGTSMADATPAEVNAWYDPRKRARPAMPRTRLFIAHVQGVTRSDLPVPAKSRALAVVTTTWLSNFGRHMGGEVKIVIRDGIARARYR
jgi:glycosyltransferase involved in cell wall biosynthesis